MQASAASCDGHFTHLLSVTWLTAVAYSKPYSLLTGPWSLFCTAGIWERETPSGPQLPGSVFLKASTPAPAQYLSNQNQRHPRTHGQSRHPRLCFRVGGGTPASMPTPGRTAPGCGQRASLSGLPPRGCCTQWPQAKGLNEPQSPGEHFKHLGTAILK